MDEIRHAVANAVQQAIALHEQGQTTTAADVAASAYQYAREYLPPDDELRRRTALDAATLAELAGNDETAVRWYADAADLAQRFGDVDILRQALRRLFEIHRQTGEYDAAAEAGERWLTVWRRREELPDDEVLRFLNDLAQVHYRAGRVEAASRLAEDVIASRQRLFPEETPALALAYLNLGTARQRRGDFVTAESHMLSALQMRRRLLPADDPAIDETLEHLADLFASQDDHRRAIPYQEEMLARARRRASDPDALARNLGNVATAYYLAGEVARSRPLYEESLALITRVHGPRHANTAIAMGNLANVLRRLEDFDGAEQLLRAVIATRRELLGDLHHHVGVAIDDLTDLFSEKGSAQDLQPLYREVLDIVLRHLDNPDAPTSRLLRSLRKIDRTHLALVPNRPRSLAHDAAANRWTEGGSPAPLVIAKLMFYLNEVALAVTLFTDACARAPRHTHEWSLATTGLAAALFQTNNLARAEQVCDDYIGAVHAGWQAPADHYAATLRTKSQVQEVTLGPLRALATMVESLAQSERARAEGQGTNFVSGLVRLAELHLATGDLVHAAVEAGRVLAEPPASVDELAAARARIVLGQVAHRERRLVEAESLFRAALPPMLDAEPTWRAALLLRDLGLLLAEANDAQNSVRFVERAKAMAQSLHGERSWQYATIVATLAELRASFGPVHQAADLFVEVAAIADEIRSPELRARALRGSGNLYTRIIASEAAEDLLHQALTAMERCHSSPAEIAGVEMDLALTEARLHRHDAACARIERAITTLRESGAERQPLARATRTKMWVLCYAQRWLDAFDAARESSNALEEELQRPLTIASSAGRDHFAAALYGHLDVVLSLAHRLRTPEATADACARTLRWKGAALTWSASQVQALAVSDAVEIKSLRRDFIDVRREIIRRTIGGAGATGDGATPTEELKRREEALDREITRQLSSGRHAGLTTASVVVDAPSVARTLPADSALIDYVRYESIDFERGHPAGGRHRGTYRYAAFVVRPGAQPALVDIGDADAIDRSVSRFRSAITGESEPGASANDWIGTETQPAPPRVDPLTIADRDWVAAGVELRRRVFDPLRPALDGCTRLCIAQHGELTRLPFAALPIDDDLLIDRYELTFLDTGRDLLRGPHGGPPPHAPLVMADPDFDLELETVPADYRVRPFERLAGTRDEGASVAALLDVTPSSGKEAGESRLRSARSPSVLHIATHGFFLMDDRPPKPSKVVDTLTMISIPGHGNYAVQLFDQPRDIDDGPSVDRLTRLGRLADPMLRSGIALSGGNTWASGGSLSDGDDGLLTAAEIALLDLTTTRLAVLSACETGLGEVHRGEGILGLRRAFAIAGVRTLVMSVWKIPDLLTRDLMIEFYHRVVAGESVARALRAAQQHVRKTASHPQGWAGLFCIGKPAE